MGPRWDRDSISNVQIPVSSVCSLPISTSLLPSFALLAGSQAGKVESAPCCCGLHLAGHPAEQSFTAPRWSPTQLEQAQQSSRAIPAPALQRAALLGTVSFEPAPGQLGEGRGRGAGQGRRTLPAVGSLLHGEEVTGAPLLPRSARKGDISRKASREAKRGRAVVWEQAPRGELAVCFPCPYFPLTYLHPCFSPCFLLPLLSPCLSFPCTWLLASAFLTIPLFPLQLS